jgi:N-acetylmuramoyl-L-alanine amidase
MRTRLLPCSIGVRRAALALVGAAALIGARPASPPGDAIRVSGVNGDTVLQLVPTPGGGLVRVDVLARLLGGTLDSVAEGRWRLALYGTSLDLVEDMPFVAYNGFALPLSESTRRIAGKPHASLQLFSEIIPRFGIGILWDRTRWEVRLFQAVARRAAPPTGLDVPGTLVVTNTAATAAATNAATSAPTASTPARPTAPAAARRAPNTLSRKYTVAVDAGHGGVDPGNPGVIIDGRRVNEAKLTLGIALKVEQELLRRGIGVVMTRSTDTLIARDDRGPIANAKKADLFVSIHTNAANPNWKNGRAVRGFETYFLSEARTEDERRVAAMENDVVRFESTVETTKGDPLSFIMNDLAQNEHLRESSDLAMVVQQTLARTHPGSNRGVKQAGFAVLARAYMPAVLIEVGFGSNQSDARWMASPTGQRDASVAIADAIFEYLLHYERRTGSQPR